MESPSEPTSSEWIYPAQLPCPVDRKLVIFLGYLQSLAPDPTLYLALIKNLSTTYLPSPTNMWIQPPKSSFDLGNPSLPSPNGPLDHMAAYARHLLAKSALSDTQIQRLFSPHGLLGPRVFPTNSESILALNSITPCSPSCASKALTPPKSHHHAEAALLARVMTSSGHPTRLSPVQTAAITAIMIEALTFQQAARLQSQSSPVPTLSYKAGADIKNPTKRLIYEAGGQRVFTVTGLLTREVEWTVTEPSSAATCGDRPRDHPYIGSSSTPPTGSTVTLQFQPPAEKIAEIWLKLAY